MSRTEEALREVILAFQDAALDDELWMRALKKMADLTGSMYGQLIGFGQTGHVAFNWITEVPPEMFVALAAVGGNDPQVNSRIRLGTRAPLLQVVDEADFETDADSRKCPAYGDHLLKWESSYVACTNLIRDGSATVGLSVNRNARQGGLSSEQRRLFEALIPHVHSAIRLRSAWASKSAATTMASIQALGVTAYLCDAQGQVLALTRSGEALALEQGPVSISGRRLQVRSRGSDDLACAIARLSGPSPLASSATLVAEDPRTAAAIVCDLFRVSDPTSEPLGSARILVVVRCDDAICQERIATTAAQIFDFTPAEAEVAHALISGRTPETIAQLRRTSLSTTRSQIRSIYEKVGASSQIGLLSLLSRYR
ncbi:MAG TPA: hypothetical protein VFF66_10995 [Brevundimonas sp.]|nr:hypothetical protein [Brevundimonas sp.]